MSEWPLAAESPWPIKKLAEVTTKIASGATPRGGKEVYASSGTALIRSQNVLDHVMSGRGLARIDAKASESLRKVEVRPMDVLLNITGDSIARCSLVDDKFLPARVNQHVAIIRVANDLNPTFLQKYLTHPEFKSHMIAMSSGATRAALTKAGIEQFPIPVPPRWEQDRIADVLGVLDDKIAINERIAATSVKIADSLFQNLMQHSSQEMRLKDLVDMKYGKALREPDRRPGSVAVYGCTGMVGWHDAALIDDPAVVVGRKGANAGHVTWAPGPSWTIDTAFYVVSKVEFLSIEVAYFLLRNSALQSLVGDSAIPGLNRNAVLDRSVLLPSRAELYAFSSEARNLLELSEGVAEQSRTLSKIRDTLLPKLMSGEIRVRDAEKQVEEEL